MTKANSDQFSALLNAAVDGILVIDQRGIIDVINAAAEKMFAYDKEELIGQNVGLLMPTHIRKDHDQFINNYLSSQIPTIIGIGRELEARKKDGSCFPIYLTVGVVREDAVPHFVGIIRDLTNQKQREHELGLAVQENMKLHERLAHVTRVSTMGEMMSGVAHEVNQPLTAIATYAQACSRLIAVNQEVTEDVRKALVKISDEAQRAGEVIRRLRNIFKRHESVREKHQLKELINNILIFADADARQNNVTIEVELADDLPTVVVDAIQIQQVILNLLHNAIEVTAETAESQAQKKVLVKVEKTGEDQISFAVIDEGVGIPEGVDQQIFDPFYTTKASGLGMGLAISRSIIGNHGGQLKYSTRPETGTTFYFTLPSATGSK